jgi:hypothetical protein
MGKFIQLNPNDNVAVCLETIPKENTITFREQEITLTDDIPVGHKVALNDIETGAMSSNMVHPLAMPLFRFGKAAMCTPTI